MKRGVLFFCPLSILILASVSSGGDKNLYRNERLGIEFEYPSNYVTNEFSQNDNFVFILLRDVKGKKTDWLFEISIDELKDYWPRPFSPFPKRPSFVDFAVEMAKLRCTADGHCSSTDCPEVVKILNFNSAGGGMGYEIHLEEVNKQWGCDDGDESYHEESRIKGPIYAFDIPVKEGMMVLFFEPTWKAMELFPEHMENLKTMVGSLRILQRRKEF